MKIANISIKEYLNISYDELQKYAFAFDYGKFEPKDSFDFGEITEQTFGFVKDLQDLLSEGLSFKNCIEFISEKTDIDISEIAKMPIFEMHKQRLWFHDAVKQINEIESVALSGGGSTLEDAAGINMFNDYRSFIQYDSLAGGDVLKFDAISKLTYSVCLTKLKLQKDRSDFEKRLHDLHASKLK